MTKADLIEEVSRVVEMTRKESEVIVEAIFDSIVRSLIAASARLRSVMSRTKLTTTSTSAAASAKPFPVTAT